MLRSAALKDQQVIDTLNGEFVPVWINVRTTPLPRLAVLNDVTLNAKLDGDNKIVDPFSKGFFVRTVVLAPDGGTILNPNPKTTAKAFGKWMTEGDLMYATVDPPDFLDMLNKAKARFHATR